MSIEKLYYENPEFWNPDLFRNETFRFTQIIEHIPTEVESLLDVGCGNGIFLKLVNETWGRPLLTHGTDRSATALSHVRGNKTEASIDRLPFRDREFDIVTCLEVVEHLPNTLFQKGLSELCRVSNKYILVSVPNEEVLEDTLVACRQCETRFNPDYHMRSFDKSSLEEMFLEFGFSANKTFYMGPKAIYRTPAHLKQKANFNNYTNPFPMSILCPVCGSVIPAGEGTGHLPNSSAGDVATRGQRAGLEAVKGLAKKVLRKGTQYGWVAALFERRC